MPRRKIELETKVKVMREILHVADVKDALQKYDVSERAVFTWYHRILEALPDILINEKPGREPQTSAESEGTAPSASPPPF